MFRSAPSNVIHRFPRAGILPIQNARKVTWTSKSFANPGKSLEKHKSNSPDSSACRWKQSTAMNRDGEPSQLTSRGSSTSCSSTSVAEIQLLHHAGKKRNALRRKTAPHGSFSPAISVGFSAVPFASAPRILLTKVSWVSAGNVKFSLLCSIDPKDLPSSPGWLIYGCDLLKRYL